MPKNQFSKDNQPLVNGRPKGAVSRTTCIRKALENVFNDSAVLEEIIMRVIIEEPNEILKLLAKLAPQKLEAKFEFPKIIVENVSPKDNLLTINGILDSNNE